MNAMFYKLLKILCIPWFCTIVTFVLVRRTLKIIVSTECHAWDTVEMEILVF